MIREIVVHGIVLRSLIQADEGSRGNYYPVIAAYARVSLVNTIEPFTASVIYAPVVAIFYQKISAFVGFYYSGLIVNLCISNSKLL
jgi:hypothetical protein